MAEKNHPDPDSYRDNRDINESADFRKLKITIL